MSAAPLLERLRDWDGDERESGPFAHHRRIQFEAADEIERLNRALSDTPSFSLEQRTAETLDAERYRYLRSVAGQWGGDECGPMVWSGCGDNFDCLRGEEVDAEVDEAMAAWKAAGSPT